MPVKPTAQPPTPADGPANLAVSPVDAFKYTPPLSPNGGATTNVRAGDGNTESSKEPTQS